MNLAEFKREFRPDILLPSITAGLIIAIVSTSVEISFAALIFSGKLSQFLAGGIGLLLFGTFVIGIVVALTTSLPGMIGVPQDAPAAVLGLVAAGIAAIMKSAEPQAIYTTILAAIALTSLLTAAFFLLLGWLKASNFIRYIPYPVVGGFLAGTGWIIAKGALGVMGMAPLTMSGLPQILSFDKMIVWIPGVIFALLLLLILRRYNHFLVTPTALLLGTALFFIYLSLAHISVADALARGWLLGPFPSSGFYRPLTPASFGLIDWAAIFRNADKIAIILILSVVSVLLNVSGLEIAIKQDIDLNRELLTASFANLANGLGSSPVGFQTLSLSALAHRLGARSRLTNLISALLCGAVLFFGASLISYFPRPVLGGLLLFLGLSFLAEWLVDARRSLPLIDYLLLWIILIIIATIGFLQGVGVGILIAAIIFVITYSRVNAIRNILNGENYHSNVDRPRAHHDLLLKRGAEIYILRLQGFIFFGTIQAVLEQVRERISEKNQPKLSFLLLDFQRVTRLDSSAVFGITRLKQMAEANSILMVWTQVLPRIQHQLERGGLVDKEDDMFIILPTIDYGMEWCEDRILGKQGITDLTGFIEPMEVQLKRVFPDLENIERLMKYLERREIKQGEYLMHEGDPSTDMFFVEAGMVTAQLEFPDGQILRLRTIRSGATVGEIALYLDSVRTASVVASHSSVVYRLSGDTLKAIQKEDPEVAALLHEWIARLLAERLADNNRTLEALLE